MQQAPSPEVDVPAIVVGTLEWFYKTFGAGWTLALLFSVPVLFFAWQVYLAIRKDRDVGLALEAKEDTIQRLAAENRMYRIQVFKDKFGWSEHQIESWIIKAEPSSQPKKKK
jgi:hypothetical protein